MTTPDYIVLDLTTARTAPGSLFSVVADSLVVLEADSEVQARINSASVDPIDLVPGLRITGAEQIWIENAAGTGRLVIAINNGVCFELGGGGGGGAVGAGTGSFGLFEAAPTTVADGETKRVLIDSEGRQYVRLADVLSEAEDTVGVKSASPGTEGNAWNGVATGAAGNSASIDISGGGVVSVFGNVDGATNIDVYYSQDGVNFYQSTHQIVAGGAGDFGEDFRIGANFVRLQSSANVTATVTVANKP